MLQSTMIDWVSIVRHSHRRLSNYWYASPSKGGRKRRKRPILPVDTSNHDCAGSSDTECGRNGHHGERKKCDGGSGVSGGLNSASCTKSAGNSPAGFSGSLPAGSSSCQASPYRSSGGGGICSEPYERSSRDIRKLAAHYKRVGGSHGGFDHTVYMDHYEKAFGSLRRPSRVGVGTLLTDALTRRRSSQLDHTKCNFYIGGADEEDREANQRFWVEEGGLEEEVNEILSAVSYDVKCDRNDGAVVTRHWLLCLPCACNRRMKVS